MAPGGRAPGSPEGLEPLTHARVEYFERERRDLVRLGYVEPKVSPFASVGGDGLSYASYFAELVDAWAQEADPNERLYRLGASVGRCARARAFPWSAWPGTSSTGSSGSRVCIRRSRRASGSWAGSTGWGSPRRASGRGAHLPDVAGATRAPSTCRPRAWQFLRAAGSSRPEQVAELALTTRGARQLATAHRVADGPAPRTGAAVHPRAPGHRGGAASGVGRARSGP